MIADTQTNFVFLSELLKTKLEYSDSCQGIVDILKRYNIKYDFLKGTKDIWARDYMPIQIDDTRFVQFRYEPTYLKDFLELQSDPEIVCQLNNIIPVFSRINLDGGNVVKWTDKVIITDRIFSENPSYESETKLVQDIENLLATPVVIIPQINSDFTGHADGLVKLVDSNVLLGNDLEYEYVYWSSKMKNILKSLNMEYISMPAFEFKERGYPYSAIGCYVNYLEINNLVIFPIFEVAGNRDLEAVDLISAIYPNKVVETININPVAREGGLMNCITWNIKR